MAKLNFYAPAGAEQQLEDIARKDKDLGLFLLNAWVWVFGIAVACGIGYIVFKTLLKWII